MALGAGLEANLLVVSSVVTPQFQREAAILRRSRNIEHRVVLDVLDGIPPVRIRGDKFLRRGPSTIGFVSSQRNQLKLSRGIGLIAEHQVLATRGERAVADQRNHLNSALAGIDELVFAVVPVRTTQLLNGGPGPICSVRHTNRMSADPRNDAIGVTSSGLEAKLLIVSVVLAPQFQRDAVVCRSSRHQVRAAE